MTVAVTAVSCLGGEAASAVIQADGAHPNSRVGYSRTLNGTGTLSERSRILPAAQTRQAAPLDVASVRPRVLSGIDVLEGQHFVPLVGARVGLVTNQTGRDANGRRTIDLLAGAGVLVAIFTPEHGLNADREGAVESARDGATGLPVYSLYGPTRRPTEVMLAGLDTIVIDLQDAGVRFYTYPTTVGYILEAAAKRDLAVYVLDRPDPINAAVVQGPVLAPELQSFTGYFPLPLRHGMTLGELAMLFNAERRIGARLAVIPMRGYTRSMWYDETGLAWVNPSPNLRSVDEATLYAGVGLIEGANVSVGRGTSSPFEVMGAPWIDGPDLARYLAGRQIAGVRFEPADFVPGADRFAARECHGVRIMLTDRAGLDVAALGLELTAALYRLYPAQFRLDATLAMIGSREVLAAIASGRDPRDLAAIWQVELSAFKSIRAKYLLYTGDRLTPLPAR